MDPNGSYYIWTPTLDPLPLFVYHACLQDHNYTTSSCACCLHCLNTKVGLMLSYFGHCGTSQSIIKLRSVLSPWDLGQMLDGALHLLKCHEPYLIFFNVQ